MRRTLPTPSTTDNVKAAFMRYQTKVRRKGGVEVNRRDYWNTFTDYTVISEGAFLSLPMDHFDMFDVHHKNKIFVYEVFFLLILFCSGPLDEKIDFAFSLFDFSGKGHLTLPDMVLLLQAVTSASWKMGLTDVNPSSEAVAKHANDLFTKADGNMDAQVSSQEFQNWTRRSLASQEILKVYKKASAAARDVALDAKRQMARVASRPFTVTGVRSRTGKLLPAGKHRPWTKAEKDKAGVEVDAAAGAGADGAAAGSDAASSGAPEGTEVSSTTGEGAARPATAPDWGTHAEAAAHYEFGHMDDLNKRTRAMKLRTMANRKVLLELISKGRFTRTELLKMAKEHATRSEADMLVAKDQFRKMMIPHLPNLARDPALFERVYFVIDLDADGKVNFREFALGMSRTMRGSLDEKIAFVFELLDKDGDGGVEIAELVPIIKRGNSELRDVISFSEEVMRACDADGNGVIDKDEFVQAMHNDSALLDAFCACISITTELAQAMHKLKEKNPAFTFERTHKVLKKLATTRSVLQEPSDYDSYIAFMREHFECTEEHTAELDAMFAEADSDDSGAVVMRDMMNGFAQVLTLTQEEQVAFLFLLYDLDNSGTLDMNEILHMLLSTLTRIDVHAAMLIDTLAELDVDGDGRITVEEFLDRAARSSLIMGTLALLFDVPMTSDLGRGAAVSDKKPVKVMRSRSTMNVQNYARRRSGGARAAARRRRSESAAASGAGDAGLGSGAGGVGGGDDGHGSTIVYNTRRQARVGRSSRRSSGGGAATSRSVERPTSGAKARRGSGKGSVAATGTSAAGSERSTSVGPAPR